MIAAVFMARKMTANLAESKGVGANKMNGV